MDQNASTGDALIFIARAVGRGLALLVKVSAVLATLWILATTIKWWDRERWADRALESGNQNLELVMQNVELTKRLKECGGTAEQE
jgi:hypothetical protein